MLSLLELLQAKNIVLKDYKIHLATVSPTASLTPLDAYFEGTFQEWQDSQNAKNFECEHILALIGLERNLWLFVGVFRVLEVEKGTDTPWRYHTELLPDQQDLIGRVMVRFGREFRQSYVWGHNYGHLLEVAEIKPQRMSIREFPGFNQAILSYRQLRLIVEQQEPSWKFALQNVRGVYLISDQFNGKHYVGCTYDEGSIWQRWVSYAQNGHGSNEKLQDLIQIYGLEYAENFQYSILEIADLNATKERILPREKYWKDALLTRQHGYNAN